MAIKLEFINVIIPVEKIREKLGDEVFNNQFSTITATCWNDGLLYRDGCMNEINLRDMLDEWQNVDFELFEIIGGKKHWKDLCVAYSWHGPSYPCEWLEYDPEKNIVWLKGHNPGISAGPAGRNVAWED